MRNLVAPPPSTHCELCSGELRLKLIDPGNRLFDTELEIFVCVKCGHHQTYEAPHDRYCAPIANRARGGFTAQGNRAEPEGDRSQR